MWRCRGLNPDPRKHFERIYKLGLLIFIRKTHPQQTRVLVSLLDLYLGPVPIKQPAASRLGLHPYIPAESRI